MKKLLFCALLSCTIMNVHAVSARKKSVDAARIKAVVGFVVMYFESSKFFTNLSLINMDEKFNKISAVMAFVAACTTYNGYNMANEGMNELDEIAQNQ